MRKKKQLKNFTSPNGGEVIIYQAAGKAPQLRVHLKDESVWLTQKQMAELFDKTVPTINEHINHVFGKGELKKEATIRNFRIVQIESGRRVVRDIELYNLDVVISVGYRVRSLRGTQFRIWATKVLRDHIMKGYTLNQQRLQEQGKRLLELEQAVDFIKAKASSPELMGQAEELLSVIRDYTHSLTLFHQYDQQSLLMVGKKKPKFKLTHEACRELIDKLKPELMKKKEAGDLFGQEYGQKFLGILGTLNQTFGGKELYGTVEEKAANLLYLTIKDHPFADSNKRTGSLLFIYFLERNNYLFRKNGERKITDTTIVALALLIASSNPKEKDLMIKLITNLLQ